MLTRGVVVALLACSASASAEEPRVAAPKADRPDKPLVWDSRYGRFGPGQFVIMGTAVAVAAATNFAHPRETHWSAAPPFDESVRDTFRLSSYGARSKARDASDISVSLLATFPFVVDSLMVAYWYRGSADVALQMSLIDAEAISVALALQGTVTWAAGRARPYVRDCGTAELPAQTTDCESSGRFRSFFSGHSSLSFVSASLVCSHHLKLDLFDSSADELTCALALGAAGATALLRVMGDMHYATDVLTGAAVGTLVGFGIPWIHHYRHASAKGPVSVRVFPTVNGVAMVGGF